ncbi:uncharacterized protein LOC109496912 [Felis catus]|uniref:uncharacterized protein LOC109496912 n=1 Tax=Felis catus TaxID=9685 RepID=UPI001D1A17F8|nr:uncharacterized protein LOC109496912 [Felis catus]
MPSAAQPRLPRCGRPPPCPTLSTTCLPPCRDATTGSGKPLPQTCRSPASEGAARPTDTKVVFAPACDPFNTVEDLKPCPRAYCLGWLPYQSPRSEGRETSKEGDVAHRCYEIHRGKPIPPRGVSPEPRFFLPSAPFLEPSGHLQFKQKKHQKASSCVMGSFSLSRHQKVLETVCRLSSGTQKVRAREGWREIGLHVSVVRVEILRNISAASAGLSPSVIKRRRRALLKRSRTHTHTHKHTRQESLVNKPVVLRFQHAHGTLMLLIWRPRFEQRDCGWRLNLTVRGLLFRIGCRDGWVAIQKK